LASNVTAGESPLSIKIRAGRPGYGKSFISTAEILQSLREGRTVYTNWPVVSEDKKYSSVVWEPWMIYEDIYDSDIYIDEAYRSFDSTEKDSVDVDTHTSFATNRHNDNNYVLIAQNVARIAKKIREIAEYEYIKKVEIPFPLWFPYVLIIRWLMSKGYNPMRYDKPPRGKYARPLWFTCYLYENEDKAQAGKKEDAICVVRKLFNYDTANAYDTHYYRKEEDLPFSSVSWWEHIENCIPVPDQNPSKRPAIPILERFLEPLPA
jgi:hypothetical protein